MTDEEQKRLKELTNKMRGEFDISGKELEEYLVLNIKRKIEFHCGADKPCPVDNCENCPDKNKIYMKNIMTNEELKRLYEEEESK